jgi:hypothetical protein
MRAAVLRSLGVIAAGAVVLAIVLYVASTVDARAPEVLSISVTQPVAGDAETALITTSIEVAFSEPVDAAAADAVDIEPAVPGTASWSGSTLIFTPSDPLELEGEYTVTVASGIRDPAGNEMSELPQPFTFVTAGRPTVVETTPADDADGVPLADPIEIRFSSLMDTASVEDRLELRPTFPHELRWSGELLEIVPSEPLRADRDYAITIGGEAADVAGVQLGDEFSLSFRTVAPGLRAETLVPADGVDGIATRTSIAIVFDRPIDPDSVESDAFVITPAVAGSLEVVSLPDDPPAAEDAGRVLRFTPSGPLPATTTFEVRLDPGLAAVDGGGIAEPLAWTFTTGAPASTISNGITFLSERSGVANVWSMNPDGTGQRQLSAELVPVVDYAVAPDGSSLVLADGRRLVFLRTDGSERRVLTDTAHLEFDPTYAPNGQRIAFARADATNGDGLGLWTWDVGAGSEERVELPSGGQGTAEPSPSDGGGSLLRAPRYAPDGEALAFVDAAGSVAVLDLEDRRLTRATFHAEAAPIWLPDGDALLLAGSPTAGRDGGRVEAPVLPLEPERATRTFRLGRSASTASDTSLPEGWLLAVAADGTIAVADTEGAAGIANGPDGSVTPIAVPNLRVVAAAFAPGEDALVVVVAAAGADHGRIGRIDVATGEITDLAPEGSRPRWLP